jgi:translation initiation factor IF-3
VPEVRVVAEDGSNLGVLSTVCKILDFGKYKYEEKKRQRDAKRKQTIVEVKEIKIRPKTDDHDLDVKLRAARKFLEAGNKVKIVCRFRGREITHPERAKMQLDWIVSKIDDLANVEQRPTMEARTMAVLIAPKPVVFQRLASERARKERERAKDERAGISSTSNNLDVNEDELEDDDDLDDEDDDDLDDEDDDDGDEGEGEETEGEGAEDEGAKAEESEGAKGEEAKGEEGKGKEAKAKDAKGKEATN